MRWRITVLVLGLVFVLGACSRPSEEDCRRALRNVQKIRGLADSPNPPDPEPAVRTCRATASKDQVACLIAAKNDQDVAACQPK
jgi:hypothetical protein